MIRVIGQRFFDWLREESRSERLLPDLTSGVVTGIAAVMFALSLGSLIFSGELAPFLPYGVRISLITATIMLVVTSLANSVTGVIGIAQDTTSVILAVIAAWSGAKSNCSSMPGIAYCLTRAALLEMRQKEPALAAAFHEYVAHLLSERLAAATRTLEAVLK